MENNSLVRKDNVDLLDETNSILWKCGRMWAEIASVSRELYGEDRAILDHSPVMFSLGFEDAENHQ